MIEYYGWATIRESYSEEFENTRKLEKIIFQLTVVFNQTLKNTNASGILEIKNGEWRLVVVGARNHRSGDWPEIYELFQWIAKNAQGSYGLLMLHDDEMSGEENEFIAYVLKKGALRKEKDKFLSPYLPEVEEI